MNQLQLASPTDASSTAPAWRKLLFVALFVGLHGLIVHNFLALSRDTVMGDGSAAVLSPLLRYDLMRVPDTPTAKAARAENRLAADFAQVYFPSRQFSTLTEGYTAETSDPWQRPSRYAPFIHAVCSLGLCRFDYGTAAFLHLAIQLLLFLASFAIAVHLLGQRRHLFAGLLLANVCLFLTPVGLSWFERGQFSLYVALAYLWLVLGLVRNSASFVGLSACFAFVKWTSFPFVAVVFALRMLGSKNMPEFRQGLRLAAVFVGVSALLFLSYPKFGVEFVIGCMQQELTFAPGGVSLASVLPKVFVKALPLALIVVGCLHMRKQQRSLADMLPYVVGCGIILNTFPTYAFDYSVPCLLGFVPLLAFWTQQQVGRQHAQGKLLEPALAVFLLVASVVGKLIAGVASEAWVVWLYVLASALFLGWPLIERRADRAQEDDGESIPTHDATTPPVERVAA